LPGLWLRTSVVDATTSIETPITIFVTATSLQDALQSFEPPTRPRRQSVPCRIRPGKPRKVLNVTPFSNVSSSLDILYHAQETFDGRVDESFGGECRKTASIQEWPMIRSALAPRVFLGCLLTSSIPATLAGVGGGFARTRGRR
jgi:hypothetical protein